MMMENVAEWKTEAVSELRDIIGRYQTIAVVRIDRIPGSQLQQIRATLRNDMSLKVAKKTFIERALKEESTSKPGLEKLAQNLNGQAAILGTNLNPFSLYKVLMSNIQPMPAKGGEIATDDIVIKEGETPFPPGPIVGELGKAGIPASIDKGKVVIKKTVTPVKKGGVISKEMAFALGKLEIFPFEVGIAIDGAWEDGLLYGPKDLDIDLDSYRTQLVSAAQMAMNLAVFAAYTTPQTIVPILARARGQALSLAVSAGIVNKDSLELIFSKAYGSALALASVLSTDAQDDELRALLAGAAQAAPQSKPETSEKGSGKAQEKPKEEDAAPSEEEAMSGLGALFG
jgi:large subunit ribosomal protein L10